jgi:hypothetical protein
LISSWLLRLQQDEGIVPSSMCDKGSTCNQSATRMDAQQLACTLELAWRFTSLSSLLQLGFRKRHALVSR